MPRIDDDHERNFIEEVANGSFRIREWWQLEHQHLRKVEHSFRSFSTMLQNVNTVQEYAQRAEVLQERWASLQDIDLPEISVFAKYLEHIHQPFTQGTARYPDLRADIDALVQVGDDIHDALNTGNLTKLKEQSIKFQRGFDKLVANRRFMMQHDVDLLCQAAYQLRTHLHSGRE